MSPMPTPPPLKQDPLRIEICKDAEDLARHAAGIFVDLAARSLGSRGRFMVALSGGETPLRTYASIAEEHLATQVVWDAVEIFWGDERCVPPDSPQSNYNAAREMLERLPLPPGNVHKMMGPVDDPETAAVEYEKLLRERFGEETPRFDLIMLGMGSDGHTASLFPGVPPAEPGRLVTVTRLEKGPVRLSLTIDAINAAHTILILVSGSAKAEMIRKILGAGQPPSGLPVQSVKPSRGQLIWLLDADAASALPLPAAGERGEDGGAS